MRWHCIVMCSSGVVESGDVWYGEGDVKLSAVSVWFRFTR